MQFRVKRYFFKKLLKLSVNENPLFVSNLMREILKWGTWKLYLFCPWLWQNSSRVWVFYVREMVKSFLTRVMDVECLPPCSIDGQNGQSVSLGEMRIFYMTICLIQTTVIFYASVLQTHRKGNNLQIFPNLLPIWWSWFMHLDNCFILS